MSEFCCGERILLRARQPVTRRTKTSTQEWKNKGKLAGGRRGLRRICCARFRASRSATSAEDNFSALCSELASPCATNYCKRLIK